MLDDHAADHAIRCYSMRRGILPLSLRITGRAARNFVYREKYHDDILRLRRVAKTVLASLAI